MREREEGLKKCNFLLFTPWLNMCAEHRATASHYLCIASEAAFFSLHETTNNCLIETILLLPKRRVRNFGVKQ